MFNLVNFMLETSLKFIAIELLFTLIGWTFLKPNNTKDESLFMFVKQIGTLTFAAIIFLLGLISGIDWRIITVFLVVIFIGSTFINKDKLKGFIRFVRNNLFVMVFSLIIFLILTLFRVNSPMYNSTEKPMDFAFIASFTKQSKIPFENPWLAGAILNYYYLGQFILAIILVLAKIPDSYGYNLLIGWVGVLILQSVYALLKFLVPKDIKKKRILLLLTATAIVFGGNMYAAIKIIKREKFFYPEPTRVVENAINEFPAYSIFLGDLHAHYIALAFFLMVIVGLYLLITDKYKKSFKTKVFPIVLGLAYGALLLTNSWDLIPTAVFSTLTFLSGIIKIVTDRNNLKEELKKYALFLFTTATLLFGFKLFFVPPIKGFGITFNNDLKYLFPLWGQFLTVIGVALLLLALLFFKYKTRIKIEPLLILTLSTGFLNLFIASFFHPNSVFAGTPSYRANTVFKLYFTAWPLIGVGAFALFFIVSNTIEKQRSSYKFINALFFAIFTATLFLYTPKAFVDSIAPKNFALFKQKLFSLPWSLEGARYLETELAKSEYIIHQIVYKLSQDQPKRILELVRWHSYKKDMARICSFTGNICFLGWPLHNMQWYRTLVSKAYHYPSGSPMTIDITKRLNMLQSFYLNPSEKLVRTYDIDIVILGMPEITFQLENRVDPYSWILKMQGICPNFIRIETEESFYPSMIFLCK